MSTETIPFAKGLEGVIAAESKICKVDGVKGDLSYYGYSIFDLSESATYEEVAYLLLYGKLPNEKELREFLILAKRYRKLEPSVLTIQKYLAKNTHPMKALQSRMPSSA